MKLLCVLLFFVGATTGASGGWLPREIHEVRAYVYDYTQEKANKSLLRNGRLHKGIINSPGAKLSDEQIERLKDALRSSEPRRSGAFCYLPHHGFVFFDKQGNAMGHIELCFQCGNVANSPAGLPETEWDWQAIRELLVELEVPILEKDEDYTKLYLKERKPNQQPVTKP